MYQWGPRCNSHVVGEKNSSVFYQKVPREAPNVQPRSAQDKRKNRESRQWGKSCSEHLSHNSSFFYSSLQQIFRAVFVIGPHASQKLENPYPRSPKFTLNTGRSSVTTVKPLNISVGSWSHILVFSNSFSFVNKQKVGNFWVEQKTAIGSLHENFRSKTGISF